jgi:TusA-related sulfurtransferase
MSASASSKSTSANEILDVRGMPSPENVLTILKRVTELPKGAGLEIRSDSNPWQLYDLLQQRGFWLLMDRQKEGDFLGKIRPREAEPVTH